MGSIPFWPRFLGFSGLLPQAACAIVVWVGPTSWHGAALGIAVLYAGLILTFLGGMWWGIAAAAPAAERRRTLRWLWIAAVLPNFVAMACLGPWALDMVGVEPSLIMLASAVLLSLGIDVRLDQLSPRWWMALRVPLSIGLATATFLCAFA
ncbi:DUF3429 family protein [Erythrobacter litoralis]|uniref:DUF3429 domain-containing protein n=1 Tax=Erythrobacter litoralis TaxID=39960 RepID=UPI0024349A34|nr:DUF3429 domain-containing protein [Erythrobacter litoralis]MDG6078918.1 DUF3429 family protein [Erythrobacter litoralis]